MRKDRQPFGVFPKRLSNGATVYYYSTYDSNGRRRQFTTGHRDYKAALKLVMDRYRAGTLVPNDNLTFRLWTANWFVYDRCPYIQGRLRRGFSYSRVHAANRRAILVSDLWPRLGPKRLDSLSTLDIEDCLDDILDQGCSADFANRCLGTLRLILGEATRLGILHRNPAEAVLPFKVLRVERGILNEAETSRLFDVNSWSLTWRGKELAFRALQLAQVAGLRQGELLGLQAADLTSSGIQVQHGWDRIGGLKGTKNGDSRFVPLTSEISGYWLGSLKNGHLISRDGGSSPVSPTYLRKAFVIALENIGICRAEQVSRRLGTHSLRHSMISNLLARGVPPVIVAKMVGHRSIGLTIGTYHHQTEQHLNSFRGIS